MSNQTEHNLAVGTKIDTDIFGVVTVGDHTHWSEGRNEVPQGAIPVIDEGEPAYVWPGEVTNVVSLPEPAEEPEPDQSVVYSVSLFCEGLSQRETFNIALIRLALEFERPVNFLYQNATGDIAPREVVPESTYQSKAGNRILIGQDTEKDEPRTYRLDRIIGFVGVSAAE